MIAALVIAATMSTGEFVQRTVTIDGASHKYQLWVPAGYHSSVKWPAVLFLHGAGERGSDNQKQIAVGLGPLLLKGTISAPALIVFPQCPEEGYWAGPERAIAMEALRDVERHFSIDAKRISMTGMSMGGTGTWILAAENPRRFSAIAPVCAWVSGPPPFRVVHDQPKWLTEATNPFAEVARRIGRMPVWIFHGGMDNVVKPEESRQMIAHIGENGAYTEFPNANHNSWDPAYSGTSVMEWLIKQRRR